MIVTTMFRFAAAAALSSFKRAPAMGGRVLDQRHREEKRSRSRGGEKKSKNSADRRVGALDERNLKKAAHRYGTLPKGARIGAYLESLRVSGMTPEPISDESGQDTLESTKSGHTDPGGRSSAASDPPAIMARSNSSHGGFPGAGARSRPGPLSSQLPRRLASQQTPSQHLPPQSPRATPKTNSALSELDFPPPPTDSLPPPATPPLLPRPRNPSSGSCDSPRSLSETGSLNLTCVSPVASPAPPDSHQAQLVQEMLAATPPLPPSSPLPPPEESSTPAAQLVTELFQSLKAKSSPDQQQEQEGEEVSPHGLKAKSSPMEQADPNPFQQPNNTPVFKPPLKKVTITSSPNLKVISSFQVVPGPVANPPTDPSPPPVNFKSQLKKTNNSALYAQPGAQEEPAVVDFKSALRKVEKPGRPGASEVQTSSAGSPDLGFRAGLRSVAGGDLHKRALAESLLPCNNEDEEEVEETILEEENKRKSTGSISSLVKMWEPSSPRDASGASAVSPSLASDSERPGSVVKFEKRVWPPVPSTETEKPMVPVKVLISLKIFIE